MAGGSWTLDLSLATAGTSSSSAPAPATERRTGARGNRRTMSTLFAELAAMLPNFPPHATEVEIVDAATEHVKVLEGAAGVLETLRAVRAPPPPLPVFVPLPPPPRNEVAVAVATVCFSARLAAPRPGALTRVLEAFHRRGVEVLMATVARHGGAAVVTVTAAAAPTEVLEMIRADIAVIS